MKKVLLVLLGIIVVTGLIIGSCGEPEETTTAPTTTAPTTSAPTTSAPPPTDTGPKHGGTMKWIAESSSSNFGWAPDTFSVVGSFPLYDGLIKDWWNGDVTPALAESWDIDAEEESITFHLRKGVTFHDGTPFNAEAVKWNYDAFIESKKRANVWESWEVIDEYTVKVYLVKLTNDSLRTFESDPIVSPTAVQANGVDWAMTNAVGTGPFKQVEFVQDVHLLMERNPDYWDGDKPYFDMYEIIVIPDYTTRKTALQAGEANGMLVEFGKQSYDFANDPKFNLFAQPQATTFMVFDDSHEDSPFYDKRVREAVDYALDREWLAENLGYGLYEPCYTMTPRPNVAFLSDYVGRQHDPEKAKQLLAEAGYPDGFKTQLLPCPLGLQRDVWVAVHSQIAEVGIDAELKFLDIAAFNEYRVPGTWQNAIIADTCPVWGNAAVGLNMMFGGGPFYNSMDKNRPDWVEAIETCLEGEKWSADLNMAAEQILLDNCSVVPVSEAGRGMVTTANVKDMGFGQRGAYFWAWAWESGWFDE